MLQTWPLSSLMINTTVVAVGALSWPTEAAKDSWAPPLPLPLRANLLSFCPLFVGERALTAASEAAAVLPVSSYNVESTISDNNRWYKRLGSKGKWVVEQEKRTEIKRERALGETIKGRSIIQCRRGPDASYVEKVAHWSRQDKEKDTHTQQTTRKRNVGPKVEPKNEEFLYVSEWVGHK